ncbi:MAG: hypothetical protein CM15mP9_0500 [Methanobacteriota archaeon]|nr:MAG: hypothetical protein CM15mP9_0500 [Euryarchaeota archaeon]
MVNQLRIEVRLPEGHWSGDVSRQRPEAVLRIEETMPLGRGRGTAKIVVFLRSKGAIDCTSRSG